MHQQTAHHSGHNQRGSSNVSRSSRTSRGKHRQRHTARTAFRHAIVGSDGRDGVTSPADTGRGRWRGGRGGPIRSENSSRHIVCRDLMGPVRRTRPISRFATRPGRQGAAPGRKPPRSSATRRSQPQQQRRMRSAGACHKRHLVEGDATRRALQAALPIRPNGVM